MHFALSSVMRGIHGFVALELDHDALWNGTVSLLGASGVLPDGLAFELGEGDPLPATRPVDDLVGPDGTALVHLGLPAFRRNHPNCAVDGEGSGELLRYRADTLALFDETTGADERPVRVGRRNFRLLSAAEVGDDVVAMPLASARADSGGHFTFDPLFVPPLLRVGASPRITSLLNGLLDMLEAKGDSLRRRLPDASTMSEQAGHELTSLWLTHAIYSGLGPLRHHAQYGRAHPREVYQDLARLAGALCTFTLEAEAQDLPLYDHDRPGEAFTALDRHIRRHLEVVIPENHLSVPLVRTAANLHTATLRDPRAMGRGEWVLRVRSSAPAATVIAEVPKKVKVCSAEDVMRLVEHMYPALPIEHVGAPPAGLSPRLGSHYFRVRREGKSWELVQVRSSVGAYVPDAIPDAEVELLIVPE
jgi:type VI secretion system protein ImpJ